jgi:deoxycytidine triphosphate deaminase
VTDSPGATPLGSVLVDHEIDELVRTQNLIGHFERHLLKGASYDLRLGREFSTSGEHGMLSDSDPSCKLEPGQFILLTSHEKLNLPKNLVGHAGLMSKWAQAGLISLFSPQIDPGFEGLIVVPLFNGGNAPIFLRAGEPMFTVEFVRASRDASFGWAEKRGAPLQRIEMRVDMQMGRPNFSAIGKDIVDLRREVSNLESRFEGFAEGTSQHALLSSTRAVWISLAVATIALIFSIVDPLHGDSSSSQNENQTSGDRTTRSLPEAATPPKRRPQSAPRGEAP